MVLPAATKSPAETVRIASNYTRLLATFLLGLLIVRLLLRFGDDAYALIALLGAGTGLASLLQEVVRSSMVPELGAAFHERDPARFRSTYNAAILLSVAAGFISLAAFGGLALLLPYLNIPDTLQQAGIFFVAAKAVQTFFVIALAPTFNMYIVSERMVAFNFWTVIERLADVGAASIVLFAYPLDDPAAAVIAFATLSAALGITAQWFSALQAVMQDRRLRPAPWSTTGRAAASLIRSVGWNSVVVLAMNLYTRLDMFLMNIVFGLFGNLIFGIASQLTFYVRQLTMGLVTGIDAVAARLASGGDQRALAPLAWQSTRLQAIVVFPAALGIIAFADPVIRYWVGHRLTDPGTSIPMISTLARILVVGIAARSLSEGWMRILAGAGKVGRYAHIVLAGALANPVLAVAALLLFPEAIRYTAPACVFALLLSVAHLGLLPSIVARELRTSYREIVAPLVRPLLATAVCLPAALLIMSIRIWTPAWFLLLALSYVGIYLLASLFIVMPPRSRRRLKNMLRRRTMPSNSVSSVRRDSMHTTRDLMLGPLRAVNAAVGERPWKNRLRARLLDWRNALPRELMVRRGDIAVQVGMWRQRNVERLSKCVGSGGRVVLVEADERNVENLLPFLRAQGIENVTVVPKAAWNRRGKFDLCVAHDPSHNRLDVDHVQMLGEVNQDAFAEAKTIEVDTVDNILSELGLDRVDYVEVSVNGAELQVLEGMQQTLPRTSRIFAAGYARDKQNGQPLNQRTESFLRSHGFHTKITTTSPPTQANFDKQAAIKWGDQEGHVFAWRD